MHVENVLQEKRTFTRRVALRNIMLKACYKWHVESVVQRRVPDVLKPRKLLHVVRIVRKKCHVIGPF